MDALESDKIQSIEGQISSIDTSIGLLDQTDDQLEGYINALKEQVLELEADCGEEREALEAAIKALQAEDESLHKQMEELKAYVDTELNGVKDWASATFVTLEEYNKTVDVITGIQAKVDSLHNDIAKEYEAAINEAIEKTAKSMESWVNEQLTGYYDIATMNTKLDSLKSALGKQLKEQGGEMEEQIAQNTEDIEALESELEKTAEDITDAYEDAIKDAIEENNGTITQSIQKAIDGVNGTINTLAGRVTDLETAVGKLEERMNEVERTLKNLASITYIPKYSDGIERVEYSVSNLLNITSGVTAKDLTLRFDVYPTAYADSIVTAYGKNKSILAARAVYTQTRAEAGNYVSFDIKSVVADNVNKGVLSVTVSPAALDTDFLMGNLEAALVLKVTTDYSNIQSDYIRLIPGNSIKDLYNECDTDNNGIIEGTELDLLANVTTLDLSDLRLTSLDLFKFTGLTTLNICDNPDLKTLNLTNNTNLTKVICSSFDYIINCTVNCAETTLFYTPDGKQIKLEDYETVIDGVTWKQFNVGARIGDIKGSLLNFSQASTSCPRGYGLPTKDQLGNLTREIGGSKCTLYHGINGRWFSGSKSYSSDIPAVFLPFTSSDTSYGQIAYYWSCETYSHNTSYAIYIIKHLLSGEDFPKGTIQGRSLTMSESVRCVKK